jgi:hypothetical protein
MGFSVRGANLTRKGEQRNRKKRDRDEAMTVDIGFQGPACGAQKPKSGRGKEIN